MSCKDCDKKKPKPKPKVVFLPKYLTPEAKRRRLAKLKR